MREDMDEVIIERPRIAPHSAPKKRRRARVRRDPEHAPLREPMRRHGKVLNENLAPLQRFLQRRIGRPWNAVWSELCAVLAPRSAVQKHVFDHVRQLVATHVVMIDGAPHRPEGRGPRRDVYDPIAAYRYRGLYVCPHTGLLLLASRTPRRRRRPSAAERGVVRLGDDLEARCIAGVWHLVTLAEVPRTYGALVRARDVVLGRALHSAGMLEYRGALWYEHGSRDRYACAMRPLGRRERRMLVADADELTRWLRGAQVPAAQCRAGPA